jgi:hypothetical protein
VDGQVIGNLDDRQCVPSRKREQRVLLERRPRVLDGPPEGEGADTDRHPPGGSFH